MLLFPEVTHPVSVSPLAIYPYRGPEQGLAKKNSLGNACPRERATCQVSSQCRVWQRDLMSRSVVEVTPGWCPSQGIRAGPNPHFSAVSEVTEKVETGSKLSMSPLPVSKLSECFSPLSLNVAVPFYSRPGTFIKRKPPNCIKAFISIFTKLPISFQPLCPSSPTLGCGLHACYPINIKHFPRGILCQIITTIRNTKVLCFVLKVTLPLTHIQAWFLFCFTGF